MKDLQPPALLERQPSPVSQPIPSRIYSDRLCRNASYRPQWDKMVETFSQQIQSGTSLSLHIAISHEAGIYADDLVIGRSDLHLAGLPCKVTQEINDARPVLAQIQEIPRGHPMCSLRERTLQALADRLDVHLQPKGLPQRVDQAIRVFPVAFPREKGVPPTKTRSPGPLPSSRISTCLMWGTRSPC